MVFDAQKPFNELPLLPGSFNYNQEILLKSCISANEALAKLNGMSLLLPNAALLMAPLLTKEAVSSSEIENINTTTIKVLQAEALGEKYVHGPEKEVLNYRNALVFGMNTMYEQGGISTNLLVKMQAMLEPDKAGVRKIPGTVIANGKGEVLYTHPEGEHYLRSLLSNIESFLYASDDIHPLIKLAVTHYQFESIHPFYDGNGRTGRMLMILYLLYTKKLEYPVLFLSDYINTNKREYYRLFQETRENNDYTAFSLYILDAIYHQSIRTQERILAISTLMKKINHDIDEKTKLDYHKITQALFTTPFTSLSDLAENVHTTRQTMSKRVEVLEKATIIKTIKVRKTKLIYVPEFIDLLS